MHIILADASDILSPDTSFAPPMSNLGETILNRLARNPTIISIKV